MRVRWLPLALIDTEIIFDMISADNPAAALRMLDRFEQAADYLSNFPHLGRTGRIYGTREYVISDTPYIIPYRVTDAEIQILRVYHAAQTWPEDFS